MATYKEIQEYIKIKYGFKAQTCWIAHMKEICNLKVRVAPNRHSATKREKPCPLEKQKTIKEAFKHFNMIE